jgi:CRP/FNR family transcriptional regulator, cyclic AMP receptor protein
LKEHLKDWCIRKLLQNFTNVIIVLTYDSYSLRQEGLCLPCPSQSMALSAQLNVIPQVLFPREFFPSMQTEVIGDLFPLLAAANPDTLDLIMSVAVEHEYPAGRAVLMEDAWGNAVYFVAEGWVKVRRNATTGEELAALAILGKGDFFGEMAVLDESPRSTDVIALTPVKLLSVAAQRFVQILFKDPQLHHRMLQLMVRRLRQTNYRFQLRDQPPAIKLVHTLVTLAEAYGQETEQGIDIVNLTAKDLADVSDITIEETGKILQKLTEKALIQPNPDRHVMHILQPRQMKQILAKASK